MSLADVNKVEDTVISARLATPGFASKSLGDSCERHLGGDYSRVKHAMETRFRKRGGKSKTEMFRTLGLQDEGFVMYAAFDIIMTARLYAALPTAVDDAFHDHPFPWSGDAQSVVEREQIVNRLLLKRSCRGIALDLDVIESIEADLRLTIAECDAIIVASGIDPSVGRTKVKVAVVDYLHVRGLLPASWPMLKDGTPSSRKEWLARVDHPLADALNRRSEAEHFLADYSTKILDISLDGRIHPQVNVLAAQTGRMSYGSPPLQQYPAQVRRMMRSEVPITSMDWTSIEPVYFANVAGDVGLLSEFEGGGDLYIPVAEAAGVPRSTAKTILLAALYGQGVTSLSIRLGIDEDQARDLRRRVMDRMPQVDKAIRKIRAVGDARGKVQTMSGRIIPLPVDPTTGGRRFHGYKGVNYVVQGSCYDLLAEALAEMDRRGLGDALFAAVHDELVVETSAADEVQRIMTTPPADFVLAADRTPVLRVGRTDLGHNWAAKG